MSMENTTHKELTPGIISLLPLFYIGWSDSILSPSEINHIHTMIDRLTFLTAEEKEYLIYYTNPKNPPSEEVFKLWLATMKKNASSVDEEERMSLAKLGIRMAHKGLDREQVKIWQDAKTLEAIEAIQYALGLEYNHSLDLLLGTFQRKNRAARKETTSFDPAIIQDWLDGNKKDTIDRVKRLLRDPYFEYFYTTDKEAKREDILNKTIALAKQGFGSYAFPLDYGGPEDQGNHLAVFETLAYGDISLMVKFGVQFGLFGGAIFMLGTEKHHRQYLQPMSQADLLGCFAMTETGHGSNVRGLETTATYDADSDSLIIHTPHKTAGKEYIGNALHAEMAVVFAQLIVNGKEHGVHAILVIMRDKAGNLMPGIKVEDCGYKIGLNGVDNGMIWFDQVKVPRENLLNKYGNITEDGTYTSPIESPNRRFFTMLGALVAGRISVGLGAINAAKLSLTIAVKYALKRRQFEAGEGEQEVLIMDYASHQKRLIPKIAKTYGYYISLRKLADDYNQANEDERREIETRAAGLKSMATWHAMDAISESREACGGKGYLSENRIGQMLKDIEVFTTFEGDNTVLMQLVAKGMLTKFQQAFHDDGFIAVLRVLRDRISNTIVEINPLSKRNDNVEHLLDRDFQLEAFSYRTRKILLSVSQRIRNYVKKQINTQDAFLKVQNHLIELAKAYVENMVLTDFNNYLAYLAEGPEKKAMQKMCNLYALHVIEENKGWYLESGYMDGTKTKAIRRLTNKLCQDIREDIDGYVDAFGIPKDLLDAEFLLHLDQNIGNG